MAEAGTGRGGLRRMMPGRGELVEMVRLALPVATVQVGMMAMGVADTIMVGHVSARDLAAVALGNLYFFSIAAFGIGVLLSLDPVISQAVGAGDREGIARGVQRGLAIAGMLGLAAALLFLPARPVLSFLRQPEDVVPVAAGYALAAMPGIFPFFGFIVLRQTLQALGRVAPIVAVIVAANLANLFFNWVFVFGNLGVPAMGAVGTGWASSLSRLLMAAGLLRVAWPLLSPYLRPLRREAFRVVPILRMVRLGAPIGLQLELEFGAFGVIALFMGLLGTVPMAGHQIALNLASLTFMIPLGIAQASSVLVGRAVGREDPPGARRAAGAGVLLGAGVMLLSAAAFLGFPGALARAYSSDADVVAIASVLIPIAGVFQVFDGLQVVASGVLRGVGDTRAPMIVNAVGFWMIGMPVSLYLGFRTALGPVGLWIGLAAGLGVVAVFLLIRVRSRLTRELSRLSIDDEPRVGPGPPPRKVAPAAG